MSTKTASETDIALLVDRLMRRMHAGVHEKAVVVDTDRIGPVGGMVLFALAEIEPAPIQTLGRMVARDKSQMTRLVNMLEQKGLLTSTVSDEDARIRLIALSPKGRRSVATLLGVVSDVLDTTLSKLDGHERATLRNLLAKGLSADP
jgi:DNA-binding MarR family transcriptional regulator